MGGKLGGVKGCVEKLARCSDDSPLNDFRVPSPDFRLCVIHSAKAADANNCLFEIVFKLIKNRA